MDPMTDIDRAIRDAMQVEPSAHFTLRIRDRVAAAPVGSRAPLPTLAVAAVACAMVAVIAAGGPWRTRPLVEERSALPSRAFAVISALPVVQPSTVVNHGPVRTRADREVVISRSEMLALQRLFSGLTVAPPPLPAPSDELSIPKLEIAPLVAGGSEGERQ
jgi:hypothetical protein